VDRVNGKVVLISGAAMGMGRTGRELLAEEGATVIVTDMKPNEGQATVDSIISNGGTAELLPINVTDKAEWKSVVDHVVAKHGKMDVLLNNAGILILTSLEGNTEKQWKKTFDINVKGVFFGIQTVLSAMKKAGADSIVNISSIYGLVGAPMSAAYQATKGAVRLFTKTTAVEYAEHKIRVNSVHPGVIDTPMTKDLLHSDEETRQAILGTTILNRPAQPREVSYGALHLATAV